MVIEAYYGPLRRQMLRDITADVKALSGTTGRGRLSDAVMAAMEKVHRHHFVPIEVQAFAYANTPLPIGQGKTISQPFIVALMTDLLELETTDRTLEIGTGFGYQAAVLAELAGSVHTVEILPQLQARARQTLHELGYSNIHFRLGNGAQGWADEAPFDKIILTAAPELIPPALLAQLKPGGVWCCPPARSTPSNSWWCNATSRDVSPAARCCRCDSPNWRSRGRWRGAREACAERCARAQSVEAHDALAIGKGPGLMAHGRRNRFSAGVVVVRPADGEWRYLLLRVFRNWDFPKGGVESGEMPLDAARREVEEETALTVLDFRWGEAYHETQPYSAGKVARYYLAVGLEGVVHLPIDPELGRPEHHEFRWCGISVARRLLPERLQPVLEWAHTLLSSAPLPLTPSSISPPVGAGQTPSSAAAE